MNSLLIFFLFGLIAGGVPWGIPFGRVGFGIQIAGVIVATLVLLVVSFTDTPLFY